MLPVGYGAMLIESVLGVVSLVIACSVAVNGALPKATPFAIFGSAIGRYFSIFGIPPYVSNCIVTMCISALAMTTIDAVTRIGRMMLQELLSEYDSSAAKFLSNTYVATIVTLIRATCSASADTSTFGRSLGRQSAAFRTGPHCPCCLPAYDRPQELDALHPHDLHVRCHHECPLPVPLRDLWQTHGRHLRPYGRWPAACRCPCPHVP